MPLSGGLGRAKGRSGARRPLGSAPDAAKMLGAVAVGHGGMAEDEYFTEWKVPSHWLDLPIDAVTMAYVEAWDEFFALVDAAPAATLGGEALVPTPTAKL